MRKQTNSKSLVIARNRKMAIMKPQLTSLIDVMTILLVFLLKSFSVEGNLISVSTDMNLAESTSRKAPVPALNLEITPCDVAVDGNPVVTLRDIEKSDSLMIPNLYEKLVEVTGSLRMLSNQGRIIIQCDRSVDFSILKKIMYTCGQAKLSNFSLLVMEKV
jgi:biopolymer transport protein ExbD